MAAGEMGAARRVGKRTPWTPQASALRSIVPTFWGSSSESSTSTNGGSPRSRARASTSSMVAQRRGSTTSATPWWPSKPASEVSDPALDLHDRDAQRRRMEHDLLQRVAAIGDDEQPAGGAPGGEGLLHRPAPGDQLLPVVEPRQVGQRRPGRARRRRSAERRRSTAGPRGSGIRRSGRHGPRRGTRAPRAASRAVRRGSRSAAPGTWPRGPGIGPRQGGRAARGRGHGPRAGRGAVP